MLIIIINNFSCNPHRIKNCLLTSLCPDVFLIFRVRFICNKCVVKPLWCFLKKLSRKVTRCARKVTTLKGLLDGNSFVSRTGMQMQPAGCIFSTNFYTETVGLADVTANTVTSRTSSIQAYVTTSYSYQRLFY